MALSLKAAGLGDIAPAIDAKAGPAGSAGFQFGSSSSQFLAAALAALAFASCFCQMFILPRIPLIPWGDPVLFLQNAMRMSRGQLAYRDFFEFVTPGIDVTYDALLRIFGARAWLPNLLMCVLAAAVALILTLVARHILPGKYAAVPALLFIAGVLPISLYATHHWFSTLAGLAAALVLIDKTTTARIVAAGIFCGIAACFTQTAGAALFAAILIFLVWEREGGLAQGGIGKRLGMLATTTAATFAIFNAYFLVKVGAAKFFYFTLVFPLRYFRSPGFNTLRIYGTGLRELPSSRIFAFGVVHLLVPLIYFVAIGLLWTISLPRKEKRAMAVVTLVGLALFASVALGPSPLRLATVTPPALILFAFLSHRYAKSSFAFYVAAGVPLILAVAIPARMQFHQHWFLDSPSGRIAFLDRARYDEFQWASVHTRPNQPFFGNEPMWYALGLWDPTPLYFTTNTEFTRPEQVQAFIAAIENSRVPVMVLIPDTSQATSEIARANPADHMRPFRAYLRQNYHLDTRFATGDEAWIRNELQREIQPPIPQKMNAMKGPTARP